MLFNQSLVVILFFSFQRLFPFRFPILLRRAFIFSLTPSASPSAWPKSEMAFLMDQVRHLWQVGKETCDVLLSFFFFLNFFYWSIVDLESCVSFRCTAKYISYTYTYICSLSDSFPIQSLHSTEQISLCYTVGPCCLSILYIVVCICQSQPPNLSLLPHIFPLVNINSVSKSLSLFLFYKFFCIIFCQIALFLVFLSFQGRTCGIGGSQARGPIGAIVASLCHSHSKAVSEPRLQPTPQLMATPAP